MNSYLIGPFSSILTMDHLPEQGSLSDDQLQVIPNGGIVVSGQTIVEMGDFERLAKRFTGEIIELKTPHVAMPGMVDAHTHICFAGDRAQDYAQRQSGKTYLEIAEKGGGIRRTVQATRQASFDELYTLTRLRADKLLLKGITTIEAKSGYGLDVENELKQLRVLRKLKDAGYPIISTCLAAHVMDKERFSDEQDYLSFITQEILPIVQSENLSNRIDIFIEKSAFSLKAAEAYLKSAVKMGFDVTIHADQFSTGAGLLGVRLGAVSVDHLEHTDDQTIKVLANSQTVATALPGASIGLGEPFSPARKLLDQGAIVAIASDWNPGSAPMGDLLTQMSILGAYEKLTIAEMLAGVTTRAAAALGLNDRGRISVGLRADIAVFETDDYRNICYEQGQCQPAFVIANGILKNVSGGK